MTRLNLPNNPIDPESGTPVGTPCRPSCRLPTPAQAHCTVCHSTFSDASYFDRHRARGWCENPASLELLLVDGLWATPEGHKYREALAARLAAGRAARKAGAR